MDMKLFKKIITMTLLPGLVMPWTVPVASANGGGGGRGSTPATVIIAPNVMILMANSVSMGNELTNDTVTASNPPVPSTTIYCTGTGCPSSTHVADGVNPAGNAPASKLYQAKSVLQQLLAPSSSVTDNINFGFATYRMIYGVPEYLKYGSSLGFGGGLGNYSNATPNGIYYGYSNLVPVDQWQAANNSGTQMAPYTDDPANFFAVYPVSIDNTLTGSTGSNVWCRSLPDGGGSYYANIGNGICDTSAALISATNVCAPKTWTDTWGGTWTVTPTCTSPIPAFFTPYSDPYAGGPGGIPVALTGNPILNPNFQSNDYLVGTSSNNQVSGGYHASYSGDQMLVNISSPSITVSDGQIPNAATTGSGSINLTATQVQRVQPGQKANDFAFFPPPYTTQSAGTGIYLATNRIPARTIRYTGSSGPSFSVQPFTISIPAGYLPNYDAFPSSTLSSVAGTVFASPADENGRSASQSWTATNTPYSSNIDLGSAPNGVPYTMDIGNILGWSGESQYNCQINGVTNTSGGCLNVYGTSAWNVSYPSATAASVTVLSGGGIQQTWTATYPAGTADPDAPNRNLVSDGFSVNIGSPSPMEDWSDIRPALAGTNHGATIVQMRRPNSTSHMGPFLDLPNPTTGYTDQRALVAGFLGFQQMRNDGDDYNPQGCASCNISGMMPYTQQGASNPSTIPVGGYYGLSISSFAWPTGSDLYDSLQNAYAYYAAYKQQDPYDNCRSNNLLLVIDGKEDARYIGSTITHVVDPVPVAQALHQNLGINVYVVIMSQEAGDVAQANAIAQAGGTNTAYPATNTTALFNALGSVFNSLSSQINTAPVAAPSALQGGGGYVYDTVDSVSPAQGHVDAFSVTGGVVASAPIWDAATAETISSRTSSLFSTGVSTGSVLGPITLLTGLDAAAFNLPPSSPSGTQSTIVDYTINPSYPCTSGCTAGVGSPYLGGRAPNAYFGLIGSDNQSISEQFAQSLQFFNPPNDPTLTANTGYMTWASNTAQTQRPAELIFPDQDGFLYAVYQNGQPINNPTPSGQLAWGWMPREFVANLQQNEIGSNAFANNHYGDGAVTVVDAQSLATQQWATYIVGNMADTQSNFALKMNASGQPVKVVYDDWRSQAGIVPPVTLPHVVQPAYFRLQNGSQNITYVVYVTTNSTQQPVLVLREVSTGSEPLPELILPFVPTSNDFILNNVLYLGDGNGNLYGVTLSTGTTLVPSLTLTTIGSFYAPSYATDADHAIAYVGGIINGSTPYIYAASSTRITVFDQVSVTTPAPGLAWAQDWTSYVGGAGIWTNGTYAPSSSGYANGTAAPTNGIQFLPLNGLITDNPAIANDALIVPVTTTTASVCSPGNAYYYLYNLLNGDFPAGTFTMLAGNGGGGSGSGLGATGTTVVNNISIGSGTAYSVSGSGAATGVDLFGSSSLSGNQAAGGVTGSPYVSFTTSGPGNQFIWWQILNN
jgi:hypothetical protein